MKKITSAVLGLSLALATVGMTFAAQDNSKTQGTEATAPAKKHVKKHNKKAAKTAPAATPAPAAK
jgi:hypothetical protein